MENGAQKHEFPCESCGASLEFTPGTDSLTCPYCAHVQAVPDSGVAVVERDFHDAVRNARRTKAKDLAKSAHEIRCTGCGAVSITDKQADHCPFCGSPVVVEAGDEEVFVPESVLPFAVDERTAKETFKGWVARLWFAPSDLKGLARQQRIDGVYLPHWTYDSQTQTRYRGQRGEHYYDTEYYTDSEGKRQSRQVRKTRWWPASGSVQVPFDDVLVCASESLPEWLVRRLEPWDLPALKPYEPAYLAGFSAERYQVDLEQGFEVAQGRMAPAIQEAIRRDIGGDEQRITWSKTRYYSITFKHFLLPLWISSFRYNEKVYRFVVNARTGEPAGERPWSWIKITLAALAVVAIIGVIVYLVMSSQSA